MSPFPWSDVLLIALLIVINGLFALSELAIVSARTTRLKAAARRGRQSARIALQLAANPGRFLSTIQIGITLIGIVAGAYSGASLGAPLGERLRVWLGIDSDLADSSAFVLVIVLTTYASLVVGELIPKRLALRSPETLAIAVARPMLWLSRFAAPLVWLLDKSSALVLGLAGLDKKNAPQVTAEDLHLTVIEATQSGVIEEQESALISSVVRLANRPVRTIMTPRTEVVWLDSASDSATLRSFVIDSPHTRVPIAEGSVDNIVGIVESRDISSALLSGDAVDLAKLIRPAHIIHDQLDAIDALQALRQAAVPMVLVHDEYGHFEGLVTSADLLTGLAGAFVSDQDSTAPMLTERGDGSLLVAGAMSAEELAERLSISLEEGRDYVTVAGYALSILRHLPQEGEFFIDQNWRFEVLDMDGRKIDKLLVSAAPNDSQANGE